jgi:outer membrane protein assembly factor BamD
MSLHFTRASFRTIARRVSLIFMAAIFVVSVSVTALSQRDNKAQTQSGLSNIQRMDIMRSKLEALKRSLDSAVAAMPASDPKDKTKSEGRERLHGLSKEVSSVLGEVNDFHAKEERADKYDPSKLDGLETTVADLNTKVEGALQATAGERKAGSQTTTTAASEQKSEKHKRGGFLGLGKKDDKYSELTGAVAPGRDRTLFLEATKEVRKGNHDTGRLLFTTIITTYPDSPYLAMAKLAIADSFYLEGGTSGLIQAGQAYQDWLTYFPTDPLADAAMLKVAETEMRQMGLPDREVTHARKAEQRLKVLLQQYPQTKLRPEVEERLRQVQDNLAEHNFTIGNFYKDRYNGKHGGLKGAQDRYKEIVEKYQGYCRMDEVLYNYAWTFTVEEEPDEAAKYYQQLVRDFPNSQFVDKAKDQLNIIGAAIPEPDPIKKSLPPCERPGFVGNMMQQITGSANISTSSNGILITKHGEGTDLIDKAIQNNGQISENDIKVYQTPKQTPVYDNKQSNPGKAPATPPPTKSNSPTSDSTARPRSVQSPTPQP